MNALFCVPFYVMSVEDTPTVATKGFRAPETDRRFFGHPVGLATLFTTELWERFSFYGMRAILVLYFVAPVSDGGLAIATGTAIAIYGVYNAMVYLLAVPGGWLADRVLGPRQAVLWGAAIIAVGHYVMAIPTTWSVWPGLVLIAVGTGLLKPNISSMVGDLYDGDTDDGTRRTSGFSLYYMGINIGGFLAPLVCGYLGEGIGWHVGFAAAGIGMTIALVAYIAFAPKTLGPIGKAVPDEAPMTLKRKVLIITAAAFGVVGIGLLILNMLGLYSADIVIAGLTVVCVATPIIYFARIFRNPDLTEVEAHRMRAYVWIFVGAVMFWLIFDQMGSTINLFVQNSTDRHIGGFEIPAAWLQSVNSLGVIVLAPVYAWLWIRLGRKAPSLPTKFAFAIVMIGMSFLLMGFLGKMAESELVPWEFVVVMLLIQVLAELLLSPTGMAASTQLAPKGMSSQVMALWFLAVAVGDSIGGQVGRLQPALGDAMYFSMLGVIAIIVAIIFSTQITKLKRLMGGVH